PISAAELTRFECAGSSIFRLDPVHSVPPADARHSEPDPCGHSGLRGDQHYDSRQHLFDPAVCDAVYPAERGREPVSPPTYGQRSAAQERRFADRDHVRLDGVRTGCAGPRTSRSVYAVLSCDQNTSASYR
ncbi:hypothetical protein JG688_00005399, partial [Phytophthora aleatoria]